MQVNVHEAKTNLSRLLERVEHGEEIVVCRAGKPVAKLIPFKRARAARSPGAWKGRVSMAEDSDELPEEVAAAFRGEAD